MGNVANGEKSAEMPRESVATGTEHVARRNPSEPPVTPESSPPGTAPDPVEVALASAIEEAAKAGKWEIVAQLARALELRRRAAAGVVELASVRAARGE